MERSNISFNNVEITIIDIGHDSKDKPSTDYIFFGVYQCIADLKYINFEKGEYVEHLSISLFWI